MKRACPTTGRWLVPTSCLLTLAGFVPVHAAPLALPAQSVEGETIPGELLDPATYGPGVVETMELALERERLRPPGLLENSKDRGERVGRWVVPSRRSASTAHSGGMHLFNEFGDLRMGISFPMSVDVAGAWFGGQSDEGVWPPALRAVAFRGGEEVTATEWLTGIAAEPQWLEMGFSAVDRIVIEALPALAGAAWYTLDDLTYTPAGAAGRTVVLDFEDLGWRDVVTGSGYAGLLWELGTGFGAEDGMPAPQRPLEQPAGSELEEGASASGGFFGGGGTAPTLLSDFETIKRNDNGSSTYPPDTCGFVGPDHFVVAINRVFAVYSKSTGAKLVGMNLGTFLPGSNGDPRVLFDHYSGRWFVMATDFSAQERFFLAVSTTSSATGSWFKTSFTADQGSDAGCWPDYPTLGVNADGLYITSYMVGCNMSIWAIDKAPLVAPSQSLGAVTAFRNLSYEGALQPCVTYGTPGVEYIVSTSGSSSLRVRRVNPPLTSPTLTTVGTVNVGSHGDPPNAPALGSSTNINTVDDRIMNAVFRNGSIWCAHNVNQSGKVACRWYQIDVTPLSMVQKGTVTDSSLSYYFPGIAVNANDDVVLACSASNASQYVGTYFTGRLSTDPPGEMAPPIQYRAGQAAQNNIDGAGRNRWGDYSLSSVDPDDDLTFWTIQEYGHANNIWGTHVAELEHGGSSGCPDPVSFCETSPNSAGPGMVISHAGSPSIQAQDLELHATGGPANQFGIFYYGEAQTQLPFGEGFRCVSPGIFGTFRLPAVQMDLFGDVQYAIEWDQPPVNSGDGELVAGDTWYFQYWYRDPAGGPEGFNLSDGLGITFCP